MNSIGAVMMVMTGVAGCAGDFWHAAIFAALAIVNVWGAYVEE